MSSRSILRNRTIGSVTASGMAAILAAAFNSAGEGVPARVEQETMRGNRDGSLSIRLAVVTR